MTRAIRGPRRGTNRGPAKHPRGARGHGSEFALACDIRFASREKAILAQVEAGCSVVPGGGTTEWLSALAGRSRTLEIIAGADDSDAERAEKYGWVNRAIPDAELDAFVDRFAAGSPDSTSGHRSWRSSW